MDALQAARFSVVVPTLNESGNVAELVKRLARVLGGVPWEVIFVDDDSQDGTREVLRELARRDGRVRMIHRIGRRGLSSAVVEGVLASAAPFVAVMDADLQHDESLLPRMFHALNSGEAELVVASRYMEGGGVGNWSDSRRRLSRLASRATQLLLPGAALSDPMSGFFALRRETFDEAARRLSGIGFKILLDIASSLRRNVALRELPYRFRTRHSGQSKLSGQVLWEGVLLLLDKRMGGILPLRFLAFSLVGGLGVAVHAAVFAAARIFLGAAFVHAQTAAVGVALSFNFLVNNRITFGESRLRGWALLRGWLSFSLACSIGAIANIALATFLHDKAGLSSLLAVPAGIAVGAVWNYSISSFYTWKVAR